jgi:hypothetical protein
VQCERGGRARRRRRRRRIDNSSFYVSGDFKEARFEFVSVWTCFFFFLVVEL